MTSRTWRARRQRRRLCCMPHDGVSRRGRTTRRGEMSRLERFIRRLQAQRACLDAARRARSEVLRGPSSSWGWAAAGPMIICGCCSPVARPLCSSVSQRPIASSRRTRPSDRWRPRRYPVSPGPERHSCTVTSVRPIRRATGRSAPGWPVSCRCSCVPVAWSRLIASWPAQHCCRCHCRHHPSLAIISSTAAPHDGRPCSVGSSAAHATSLKFTSPTH